MCERRVRDYPQPAHSLATTAFDALSGKRWQWSGRHITPVFPSGSDKALTTCTTSATRSSAPQRPEYHRPASAHGPSASAPVGSGQRTDPRHGGHSRVPPTATRNNPATAARADPRHGDWRRPPPRRPETTPPTAPGQRAGRGSAPAAAAAPRRRTGRRRCPGQPSRPASRASKWSRPCGRTSQWGSPAPTPTTPGLVSML